MIYEIMRGLWGVQQKNKTMKGKKKWSHDYNNNDSDE